MRPRPLPIVPPPSKCGFENCIDSARNILSLSLHRCAITPGTQSSRSPTRTPIHSSRSRHYSPLHDRHRPHRFAQSPSEADTNTAMTTPHPRLRSYLDKSQPVDRRVEDILARMTLEEKISYIGGTNGFYIRAINASNCPPSKCPTARWAAATTAPPPATPAASPSPSSGSRHGSKHRERARTGLPRPRRAHPAGARRQHLPLSRSADGISNTWAKIRSSPANWSRP